MVTWVTLASFNIICSAYSWHFLNLSLFGYHYPLASSYADNFDDLAKYQHFLPLATYPSYLLAYFDHAD
jgi:hypothetical protein